jgi:hypothetical protein
MASSAALCIGHDTHDELPSGTPPNEWKRRLFCVPRKEPGPQEVLWLPMNDREDHERATVAERRVSARGDGAMVRLGRALRDEVRSSSAHEGILIWRGPDKPPLELPPVTPADAEPEHREIVRRSGQPDAERPIET